MTEGDRALDYEAVSLELASLGLGQRNGEPYSRRQVQRMHESRKLPFFEAPDRQRRIMRSVLLATVESWQVTARKDMAQARAEVAQARRKRRS